MKESTLFVPNGVLFLPGDCVSTQDIPSVKLIKQIVLVFVLIVGVIFFGTTGYMILEHYDFQDAFFLTSITISTVGYSFPEGMTTAGVYFTMILIALGVSVVLYGVTSITGSVVEGRLNVIMKLRRYRKMIEKMSGHVIVVGAGRTGRFVMLELQQLGKPFVLVDQEKENIDRFKDILKEEFPYILGDATDEDVLLNAGIKKASSIIVTLPTDSLNVYVVLSAKTLNPTMNIIAKSSEMNAAKKLTYAGATNVVTDSQITGIRMARIATKPDKIRFLDVLAFGNQEFRIEEIYISGDSPLANKTLMELGLSKTMRVIIIAIRRESNTIFGPIGETKILPEDYIMVLGSRDGLNKIAEMAKR